MKSNRNTQSGLTIIELSVTLAVMLLLAAISVMSIKGISEWKLARQAGEELRAVYIAQKNFLADNPTFLVADLTADDLVPYLPGGRPQIPSIESLDHQLLMIHFNVIPPVVSDGSGGVYDPSGKDSDALWDAGIR